MNTERYQIIEELASGKDVRAYKALDVQSATSVHIKEMLLQHVESWKAIELFEREVATLRQLNHAQIPAVVDHWTESDDTTTRFGLARVWVDGTPLSDHLSDDLARIDEDSARELLRRVAPVLTYLHSFRPPVVHRDLTPAHLVRSDDGEVHLVGFGGVQAALPRTQGGSTFVGTSGYVPPEQLMGKASPASDVYALAATCIALLSGLRPTDLTVRNMRLEFEAHVDISPALEELLRQMLAPLADRRPPDGASLMRRLEHLDASLTVYEAKLLDDPVPGTLKVRWKGDRLVVRAKASFKRSGALQISSTMTGMFAFAGLLVGLFFALQSAPWFAPLVGLGAGTLIGLAYSLFTVPFAFLPIRIQIDDERIRTTFWLRSARLEDVDEVAAVDNGFQHNIVVYEKGEPRAVAMPLDARDAEWIAARIRDRLQRND